MKEILCGLAIRLRLGYHDLRCYGGDTPTPIREWEVSRSTNIEGIPALGYELGQPK